MLKILFHPKIEKSICKVKRTINVGAAIRYSTHSELSDKTSTENRRRKATNRPQLLAN